MADDRAVRLLMRFETDKNSLQKAQRDLESLEKAFEEIPAHVKRANAEVAQLTRTLIEQQRANIQNAQGLKSTGAAADALGADITRTSANIRDLIGGFSDTARAIDTFGSSAASARAEVRALNREMDKAGTAARGMGGRDRNIVQRFGTELRAMPAVPIGGGLSTDMFARMITLLGGLNPVVLGATAAIGGLIVGLQALARDGGAAIQSLINSQEEYYRALKTGTTESITESIAAKQIEVDILRARTQEYQTLFAQFEQQAGVAGRAIADVLNIGNTQTLRKELEELEAKLRDEEFALSRLNNALGSTDVAANDLAAAEAQLAERRAKAMDVIAQLSQQRAQLETNYEERALDAFIDRAIRERRANEDLERALELQRQAHIQRLESIEATGLERIAGLRDQGVKRLAQFDQQTGAIQDRLAKQINSDNERLRKLNADYMRSEREAVEKYRAEEAKRTRDYNKERVRLLEDLNSNLLSAQEANDVVAFIQAQRAGELRLKRQAEDAQDEDKERANRFEAERREAEQRRADRIAEIQAEAAERQQAIADELAARQAARREIENEIALSVEAEKARIQEQLQAQQAAYDERLRLDAEERAIRDKRQQEDLALQEARERDALDKQLRNIDWRIQMEADAARLIVDFGQQGARIIGEAHVAMANAVAQELARTAQAARSGAVPSAGALTWSQSRAPRISGGGGGGAMFAFADGGIIDRPTFGLFGERPGYAEAFIPFRKSEGIEAALNRLGAGGTSVVFNAPIAIGADMTRAEVERALAGMAMAIIDGMAQARAAR